MKKTRILAALLCIMMLVCTLPVMMVSAAEGDTFASVSDILGIQADVNSSWSYNFEGGLTGPANTTKTLSATGYSGTVDYNEEGMFFETTDITLWYAKPQSTNPYGEGTATVITFKFGANTDKLGIQFSNPYESSRTFSNLTASNITSFFGSDWTNGKVVSDYAFGTDWNDLMYVLSETGYQVYVRKTAGNGAWTLLQDITGYRAGTTYGHLDISASANTCGAVIKSITTYTEKTSFDSMDEILGGATGASYAFDFNENSSLANTPGANGIGYVVPTGAVVDQDGLTFGSEADLATANFNFYPFYYWSPLNASDDYKTDFEPQAFYMMAKGAMNLQLAAPTADSKGRVYLNLQANKKISPWLKETDGTSTEYNEVIVPADEWLEYLIVPNGTDNTNVANGFTVYAKGTTATNGKWLKVVKTNAYNDKAGVYSKMGFQFYNLTGHVKKVRALALERSATDAATLPADADYLYFSEEFDAAPTYANTSFQTVKYEEGNAVLACNDTTGDSKVIVKGLEIPVGGYAEFKAKAGGKTNFNFHDGEKKVNIVQQTDFGSVTGGTGRSATSTETWKTWRVVRTADGYTIYGKAEGDSGWFVHTQNAGAADTATEAQINLIFSKRNDGETGDSQLAYLKVYGPAPTEKLVLTDGYNTIPIADKDTLAYPNSLRAIVTEETAQLLVVTYKGELIAKIEVLDAAELKNNEKKLLDVSSPEATHVKVFLWKGFENIEPLNDVVNLNL